MQPFSSNRELYYYLLLLSAELKRRKLAQLSEIVSLATQHAADMSAEFLGESRIALQRLLREEDGVLTAEERRDMSEVLRQLDDALDRRGSN